MATAYPNPDTPPEHPPMSRRSLTPRHPSAHPPHPRGPVPVLLLLCLLAALPAHAAEPRHWIERGNQNASLEIPDHDLVTVNTSDDDRFLFYSIQAGYEAGRSNGPYTNVPAELNLRLVAGSLDDALAKWRKQYLTPHDRYEGTLTDADGRATWLLTETDADPFDIRRAFVFIPVADHVVILDASASTVPGMPKRNRDLINRLLKHGLTTVEVNDEPLKLDDVYQHLQLR